MEAFIEENPAVLAIDETMRPVIRAAQLLVSRGRPDLGTDGRIDLVCQLSDTTVAVIENKVGRLEDAHLKQLQAYLDTLETKKKVLGTDLASLDLVGMMVGSDISDALRKKIEEGAFSDGHQIYAITIQRYSRDDRLENYFLVEHIAQSSGVNRHRFTDFAEFLAHQKERGVAKNILPLIESCHSYIMSEYRPLPDRVQYARHVFTFAVPKRKRSRVFAYCVVQKSQVKVYVTGDSSRWEKAHAHPQHELYPDQVYFVLSGPGDIDGQFKAAVKQSYQLQMDEAPPPPST